MNKRITSIGGQALMEGIMMMGPTKISAAFCDEQGNITVEDIEATRLKDKYPILGKPFIRGIFAMIDSFRIGYKALSLSAEKIGIDGDEEPSGFDKWLNDKFGDKLMNVVMGIAGTLGVTLAIALFFFLPSVLFNLIQGFFGEGVQAARAIFEGVFRLIIFLSYLFLTSLIPDIKRTFMYHGAEHKTIFCYEAYEELTIENVKKQSRFHPRCGTSFLVLMLIIGIIVSFFIPFTNPFVRTLAKLLTIPIVMNIGYELLKLCGKHDNLLTRIIAYPGLLVQRITTKEPTDKMIEAAIAAIESVIPENGEDLVS